METKTREEKIEETKGNIRAHEKCIKTFVDGLRMVRWLRPNRSKEFALSRIRRAASSSKGKENWLGICEPISKLWRQLDCAKENLTQWKTKLEALEKEAGE